MKPTCFCIKNTSTLSNGDVLAVRCLQTASVLPSAPVQGGSYFGLGEAGVLAELGY